MSGGGGPGGVGVGQGEPGGPGNIGGVGAQGMSGAMEGGYGGPDGPADVNTTSSNQRQSPTAPVNTAFQINPFQVQNDILSGGLWGNLYQTPYMAPIGQMAQNNSYSPPMFGPFSGAPGFAGGK